MSKQLTKENIESIVAQIALPKHLMPDYKYWVYSKDDGFLLQLTFYAVDVEGGMKEQQRCRKWYVSSWSTHTEVVETAFKAAKIAMEHELKEFFAYKGFEVYNPHFDVEDRILMAERARFDIRKDER